MRSVCCLAWLVLLLLLVRQAFSHQQQNQKPESETAKRKSIRSEALDYDPNSQTVIFNITFGRPTARRFVNNLKLEVLRWPDTSYCSAHYHCHQLEQTAAVIKSSRICLTSLVIDRQFGMNCDQIVPAERDRTIVRLDHIFTGCYCFRLATYRDDSIRTARQLVDRPRLMQTDVIEYDVFKWNLSLDLSATSNHDLRLFIKLDDETAFVDNIYHVELFRHQEMSADLMACHETDDPMNQHLTFTFSQSDQHQHWMTFHNRSLGYYCVLVIPEDDRCHPPFVDFERTCARHSNVVQLIGTPNEAAMTYYSTEAVTAYLITALVLVLVTALVTLAILLNQQNDRLIEKQRVSDVKNAIWNHVSTQIYDQADERNSVDVDGVEWFTKYLQVANIRIVIILCPEMMHCQQWLWNKNNTDDENLDLDCCYRLRQLIEYVGSSGNVYRQVYAIHFDDLDDEEGNRSVPSSCFLTPYRSYHWPADQSAFLTELSQG